MKASNDWRSLLFWYCCIQFNSDNRLSAATGSPPRHLMSAHKLHWTRTTSPRQRRAHKPSSHPLNTTSSLPEAHQKAQARPETSKSMPVSCCAIVYSALITYGQWGSYRNMSWIPWGIITIIYVSHWEYTEDAPAADRRFKRAETAERDKYKQRRRISLENMYVWLILPSDIFNLGRQREVSLEASTDIL